MLWVHSHSVNENFVSNFDLLVFKLQTGFYMAMHADDVTYFLIRCMQLFRVTLFQNSDSKINYSMHKMRTHTHTYLYLFSAEIVNDLEDYNFDYIILY